MKLQNVCQNAMALLGDLVKIQFIMLHLIDYPSDIVKETFARFFSNYSISLCSLE